MVMSQVSSKDHASMPPSAIDDPVPHEPGGQVSADFDSATGTHPPPGHQPRKGNGDGHTDPVWAELREQELEFERHSQMLAVLRGRLEKYLGGQSTSTKGTERAAADDRDDDQGTLDAEWHRPWAGDQSIFDDDVPGAMALLEESAAIDIGEYQARIDTLEQEKSEIEKRLRMLQLKARGDPVGGVPTAAHSRWRTGAALVLGLAVAGTVFWKTDFHYRVQAGIAVDSTRLEPDLAKSHSAQLKRALHSATGAQSSGMLVGAPQARFDARARSIEVSALSANRSKILPWFRSGLASYLEQAEAQRLQAIAETRQALQDIEEDLFASSETHRQLITRLAEEQSTLAAGDPKAEFQQLRDTLSTTRASYEQIQAESLALQRELYVLKHTEIPELPEVDAATRREAESEDRYLTADMQALGQRVQQMRAHLLADAEQSAPLVEKYGTAAGSLRSFLDTQKLHLERRKVSSDVDELIAKSHGLMQCISDFGRQWHLHLDALRRLDNASQGRDCLDLQRSLEELIKRFNYEANLLQKEILQLYKKMGRELEGRAEFFQLRNGLARENALLVKHQLALADFLQRFLSQGDFKLEATVHSAVGLTRRVRDRAAAIEEKLSRARHAELVAQSAQRIKQVEQQVAALNTKREDLVQEMLRLHDAVGDLVPTLEVHSATAVQVQYESINAQELTEHLNRQSAQKQQLRGRLDLLEAAEGGLTLGPVALQAWPVNAVDRLSQVGFGGLSAVIIAYLFIPLLVNGSGRSRSMAQEEAASAYDAALPE